MFNMKQPCANCPFRTDCLQGWLGAARAQEIANSLLIEDKTFPCHKTVDYSDEYDSEDEYGDRIEGRVNTERESHCAGALILMEKLDRPNQMMRIAERIGYYDRTQLKMDAPVFDTEEEFVQHHGSMQGRGER